MAEAGVVAAILGKELRQTWRDRSVLILIFLMPLALAGITSFAFSGLGSAGSATIGVVDGDGGASAQVLVKEVLPGLGSSTGSGSGTALIKIVTYASADAADAAVSAGDAAAAIVIPQGFSAAVQAGDAAALTLVTGSSDSLGVPVATSVLDGFTAQIGTNALSVQLVGSGAGATPVTAAVVTAANAQRSPVALQNVLAGNGTLKASSFFAPSMMILALFFCGQMLARGLVAERRTRTLARILLAGVRPGRLLLAKYLMALGTGLVSALVVLGLFAAFGSRFGNLWVLILLVVLSATAMMSAASLAVLASRTEEQAGTLGTVVIFVLAILGGNFVPLSQTHGFLGTIALLTPNGWAIRGFADLSVANSGSLSTVGTTLLVLAGFTLLLGIPAVLLSSRVLQKAGCEVSVPGTIAVNNLRRIVRQPIMLFTTLVLPFLVIAVVGFALGGSRNALQTGVVSHDSSSTATALVEALRSSSALSVTSYPSDSDLERAVRRGEVSAGVVIPAGYEASVRAGAQSTINFVTTPNQTRAASIRTVVQSTVQAQVGDLQAASFSEKYTGRDVDAELSRAADARAGLVVPTVTDQSLAATASTSLGFDYTAPSNLVLFIVITSLTSAGTLVESRTKGITARMMAMPPSRTTIVAGELLGRLVIALAQAAIILLFSSLLFGVKWGDPLGVAAITVMMCAVGAALGLLVGFGAKTLAQTASFGPPLGVVLGMLGGCMWPLSIVGGTVVAIGHISPNAWAMDGYLELINNGAGFADILPQFAVLCGFAAVVLALAGLVVVRRGAR